ncbi:flavodoxin family protein [Clostridium akagii]|uniref:flavodoxin family protein n=1 Tax=Clostridium akagii TaxID=91623 RepID=UPI00047E7423|nr:flavodoxin family protein [Clostridium akagii]
MKVVVITGSAHKKGTSALLADKFMEGATEVGHEVFRFDAAFEEVKPCLSCDYCSAHDSNCVHKDSMEKLNGELATADMVVFATPIYYYTMSAQIKAVIDRFHAKNAIFLGNKKAIMMATAYGDADWTMDGLDKTFELMLGFLNWKNAGTLYATGCPAREVIEQTDFPKKAYEMGKNIK